MFGNNKDDVDKALDNTEDSQDSGGFISPKHPDPLGVPEPPAPGDIDTSDNSSNSSATSTPQFGQPFTPGSVLPPADSPDDQDTQPADEPSGDTPVSEPNDTPAPASDDLINIKKEALQQLTPLVGHLDQTPEEQFKTTMMMIQAADDQTLIKKAYDAAQQISDDKAKAQALLDIVNEINYFTQHDNQSD